jgi:multidrug efflux pump subunit AcrA (membrane-fusion protein)
MMLRWMKTVGILTVVGGGVVAAAFFGLIPGWKRPAEPTASAPPTAPHTARHPEAIAVTVTAAVPRTVERRVRTVGTLHGFEEIEISPQVDGTVRRVARDVGDLVSPGDLLLEIDATDFQLAVQENARALELELARLGLNKVPDASFSPETLPSVERARLVERNAADTFDRYKALTARGVMTKDDYEKAELNLQTARLDTKQRLLEAEQTLAAVRHRQAVLETAGKRLRDTRILAPAITVRTPPVLAPVLEPATGSAARVVPAATDADPALAYTVAERFVSEGEIVRAAPPTKLFRLVVDSVLKLKAAVPERYASQVRPGQEVDLAVESLSGRTISGRVARVNPTVDTANRTFEVEVWVPNRERLLKSGSFATASILLGADAGAVTVPEEAIVRYAGVTKLFTVVDDKAVVVPVELGSRLDIAGPAGVVHRWVEVSGSLAVGVPVVTTGHSQLSDGASVRVREASRNATTDPATAPPAAAQPDDAPAAEDAR